MRASAVARGLAALGLAALLTGCGVDVQSAPVPLTGDSVPGIVPPTVTQRPTRPSPAPTSAPEAPTGSASAPTAPPPS